MFSFFITLEKLHFELISKFKQIFSLSVTVTLVKLVKLGKFKKLYLGLISRPFWPKHLKSRFSLKMSRKWILSFFTIFYISMKLISILRLKFILELSILKAYCHMKIKKPYVHLLIKNIFDRNECKTLIVCFTFLFYKKHFLWENGLKAFLFSCDDMSSLRNALKDVL